MSSVSAGRGSGMDCIPASCLPSLLAVGTSEPRASPSSADHHSVTRQVSTGQDDHISAGPPGNSTATQKVNE